MILIFVAQLRSSLGLFLVASFFCFFNPLEGYALSINSPEKTWNGAGEDSLWSNSRNWTGDAGAPSNNETVTLTFTGQAGLSTNNLTGLNLVKLIFSDLTAGSLTLGGNPVNFTGDVVFAREASIENNSPFTQTIDFSGDLVGLNFISAKTGLLVFNSTVTSSGLALEITGSGKVLFNNPVLGMKSFQIFSSDVTFNNIVSTSIAINHATATINSLTQLPAAEIEESGTLRLSSDVTMPGPIDLVAGISTHSVAGSIDTNGFTFTLNGGLRDGGGFSEIKPAKLNKTGAGTLIVSGDNTLDGWSGGTTISGGTLRAGTPTAFHGSSTSFSLGDVEGVFLDLNNFSFTLTELNGGGEKGGTVLVPSGVLTVDADETSDSRFAGRIHGEGSLIKEGSGVLWLTGLNDYAGGTTVNAGTLRGNTRGIQGDIENNASVIFDHSDSGTYAGELSGNGTLEKTGPGSLTLAGDNSLFLGTTTIAAGILAVGHSNALGSGNVAVTSGTLKTDGKQRNINIQSDLMQTGGTIGVTLYDAGVGQQDRLSVAGMASIGGNLTVDVRPGYLPMGTTTYVILDATSLNGKFNFTPPGVALRFELTYTSSQTLLTATKTPFAPFSQTPNQTVVANYLDTLYPHATGDLALVLGELNALPAQDLSNALKAFSPQPYQTMSVMGMSSLKGFSQRIHSQLARRRAGARGVEAAGFEKSQTQSRWGTLTAEAGLKDFPLYDDPYFVPDTQWGAFITGDGSYANIPGDDDVSSGQIVSGGLTTGIDYRFSHHWNFGLGLGYSISRGETGTEDMVIDGDSLTPGLYGSYNAGRYYVDALWALQSTGYKTKRKVIYGTQNMLAEASPKGNAFAVGFESGFPIRKGEWNFIPVGGLQLSQETVKAYEESGAGAVSLSVGEKKGESLATQVGLRVTSHLSQDSRDHFELRSAWRHEFRGQTSIDASFVGAGGSFTVTGSNPKKNSILVGGELSAAFSDQMSFIVSYDGDLGAVSVHRVNGGARFQF